MFSILQYHVNELWIMLVLINVITLGTLWCMVKNDLRQRYQFRLTPILVKNRAWSPPFRSVPLPFPSFPSFPPSRFLHQLLHQLRYHFFPTSREVLYMVATVSSRPSILAPILGEISGLVCNLEAKISQNYCFLTQMLKSDL